MDVQLISALVGRFAGRPAIVMGGAPSLESDLEQIPDLLKEQAVWISANEHGVMYLVQSGLAPDFVVANDRHHQDTGEPMLARIRKVTGAPVISHRHQGDYRIHDTKYWNLSTNSGLMAIFVAWLLVGPQGLVIPTGIQHYQKGTYWHDTEAVSSGTQKPSGELEQRAASVYHATAPARIRPVSGPLTDLWEPLGVGQKVDCLPAADPEWPTPPHQAQKLRHYSAEQGRLYCWVKGGHALAYVGIDGPFQTGEIIRLTPAEAAIPARWGWIESIEEEI